MVLQEKIDIENNVVTYTLQAKYNEELTDEEVMEIEALHDYVRKIKFADIDFAANVDMSTGTPVVTDAEASDTIVAVSLGKIAPKEYVVDENLNITFSVDAGRIPASEVNDVLNTAALVSQAKIAVFQAKVKKAILAVLNEMRNEDNDFEKESETIA